MKNTRIRRAEYGDERGIHNAHMESIRELCSKDFNVKQINAWVVKKENLIEGYGVLVINKVKGTAEIGGLYLTPIVTGQGLGKQIIDEMKVEAKNQGFEAIFLDSTITSKIFYEKQGAVQYEDDTSTFIGGVHVECHPMRIIL